MGFPTWLNHQQLRSIQQIWGYTVIMYSNDCMTWACTGGLRLTRYFLANGTYLPKLGYAWFWPMSILFHLIDTVAVMNLWWTSSITRQKHKKSHWMPSRSPLKWLGRQHFPCWFARWPITMLVEYLRWFQAFNSYIYIWPRPSWIILPCRACVRDPNIQSLVIIFHNQNICKMRVHISFWGKSRSSHVAHTCMTDVDGSVPVVHTYSMATVHTGWGPRVP